MELMRPTLRTHVWVNLETLQGGWGGEGEGGVWAPRLLAVPPHPTPVLCLPVCHGLGGDELAHGCVACTEVWVPDTCVCREGCRGSWGPPRALGRAAAFSQAALV